jgi:hypothetical protein
MGAHPEISASTSSEGRINMCLVTGSFMFFPFIISLRQWLCHAGSELQQPSHWRDPFQRQVVKRQNNRLPHAISPLLVRTLASAS